MIRYSEISSGWITIAARLWSSIVPQSNRNRLPPALPGRRGRKRGAGTGWGAAGGGWGGAQRGKTVAGGDGRLRAVTNHFGGGAGAGGFQSRGRFHCNCRADHVAPATRRRSQNSQARERA